MIISAVVRNSEIKGDKTYVGIRFEENESSKIIKLMDALCIESEQV